MILEKLQDDVVHHSANAAAVVIPPLAVITTGLHSAFLIALAYTPGVLGAAWYCILISEKISALLQRHRKRDKE